MFRSPAPFIRLPIDILWTLFDQKLLKRFPRWSLCFLIALVATLGAGFYSRAQQQSVVTWVNGAGGNWNVASNWRDATGASRVPTATDDVVIDLAGTYVVTLDVNATVAGLTLGANSGVQTLSNSSFTLTLSGDSAVNTNG